MRAFRIHSNALPTSPRGRLLAWSTVEDFTVPVVTVELAQKWYGLQLVKPSSDGPAIVEEVPFPTPERLGPRYGVTYVDHVPNPRVVEFWAFENRYFLDELALEMMWGRWLLEVEDR